MFLAGLPLLLSILSASSPSKMREEGTIDIYVHYQPVYGGFSCDSGSKESACNAGDSSSIPGSGKSPGGGNGNPLQYSCLENSVDKGAWQATVLGVTRSLKQLRMRAGTYDIAEGLPRWHCW